MDPSRFFFRVYIRIQADTHTRACTCTHMHSPLPLSLKLSLCPSVSHCRYFRVSKEPHLCSPVPYFTLKMFSFATSPQFGGLWKFDKRACSVTFSRLLVKILIGKVPGQTHAVSRLLMASKVECDRLNVTLQAQSRNQFFYPFSFTPIQIVVP